MTTTIAVTGATGMIGRRLCQHLGASGHHVIPLGRTTSFARVKEWRLGDSAKGWLAGVDVVVHLAARVHVTGHGRRDASGFELENADATHQLAMEAAECGVRRFIFVSSIGVLGAGGAQALRETDPHSPPTAYAASKHRAEELLSALNSLEVVVLRPPAVVGYGVRGNLAALVRWIRQGVPLPFASIENARQFVTLEDLVSALHSCISLPDLDGEVFHVANEETFSTPEFCRFIAEAAGQPARLFRFPPDLLRFVLKASGRAATADALLGNLLVDTHKARERLGWRPKQSLESAVRQMVREG